MPLLRSLFLLLLAFPLAANEVVIGDAVLEQAAATESSASVASDGTDFLVTWVGRRVDRDELFASRITRDGVNLDPTGIVLDRGMNGLPAAIASGGDRWLVVHARAREVRATLLERSGAIVKAWTIDDEWTSFDTAPRAAWNGREFLITWNEPAPSGGYGLLVTRDGDPIGAPHRFGGSIVGLTVRNGEFVAAVIDRAQPCRGVCELTYRLETLDGAFATFRVTSRLNPPGLFELGTDGDGFLLAWVDTPARLQLPDAARAVRLDRNGQPGDVIELASGAATHVTRTQVLWTGSEYLVGTSVGGRLSVSHVGRETVGIAPGQGGIAAAGDRVFAVWVDPRALSVFGRMVGAGEDIPLAMRPGRQSAPRVAANGLDLFVVWQAGSRSAGALVRDGITIRDFDFGVGRTPDVAFDGAHYLVVSTSLNAQLLRADGTHVLDIELPAIAPLNETPRVVASPGGGFLIVWQSFFNTVHARISAVLISREGLLLTPRPIDVMPEGPVHRDPDVAVMGDEYLVAAAGSVGLRVARLSRFGEPLESALLPYFGDRPAIAASDDDAMLVWNAGAEVHAVTLDRHLTPGERVVLSTAAYGLDVLREKDGYAIVFSENDVIVARGKQRIVLTKSEDLEYAPAAALAADGLAVAYARGERVFLRLVQASGVGGQRRTLAQRR